ncbi:hypothetical protein [Caballeronia glathei]|jgi:hypothetical protein|uniref:Uncharacterized protein n=1 Tax=Caballeronia glathei TaxID=60547 RepID=A0A069PV32_9BURK|nr:hypothetical protein [Caballeronia glathei]KDR44322.1 hypothetical protein BG61_19905 [Caballeronia glathei]
MPPTEAPVKNSVRGPFEADAEHQIDTRILAEARAALEGAAAYFSRNAISDANVRTRYAFGIKRMSESVPTEVDAGRMSAVEGAAFCHDMRNRIMEEARKITSPVSLARAQAQKAEPPSLGYLLDRYSTKNFSKPFRALTEAERDRACYAIIESSGRSNAEVSAKTARLRVQGKVGLLITGAIAGYEIVEANDKMREAERQVAGIEGGMLGGTLAGMVASSICGPGAPICAIGVLLIGSSVGATVTQMAYDAYLDELEEFRTWGIR